jgi:hypothetical protein
MPDPDCKIHFINGQLINDPPLDTFDEFGNVVLNPTGDKLPRSREQGMSEMVRSVVEKNKIKEDFTLHLRIADGPWEGDGPEPPPRSVSESVPENLYSMCVFNEQYHKAFPDFMYVSMRESGFMGFTETINSFRDTVPKTNKIGWIGSCSCGDKTPRPKFIAMSSEHPDILDGRAVNLDMFTHDGWKNIPQRMSYQDQVDEWKYLIDIEGCGYSGRFKVLMNTPRIVFFVDRSYQEWFFGEMHPWIHYVPVKRDLSDLIENYHKIESDLELQKSIKYNQKMFAKKYLTREAAEDRIFEIIKEMIEYKRNSYENFY